MKRSTKFQLPAIERLEDRLAPALLAYQYGGSTWDSVVTEDFNYVGAAAINNPILWSGADSRYAADGNVLHVFGQGAGNQLNSVLQSVDLEASAAFRSLESATEWVAEIKYRVADGDGSPRSTSTNQSRLLVMDNTGGGENIAGAYLSDPNSDNAGPFDVQYRTSASGGQLVGTITSNQSAAEWHTLGLHRRTNGQIDFYVDGVLSLANQNDNTTATIAGPGRLSLGGPPSAAAHATFDVDYLYVGVREIVGVDFGDAPLSYGTASAAHLTAGAVRLGANRDNDAFPAGTLDGTNDDLANTPDDEDGVTFNVPTVGGDPSLVRTSVASITVNAPAGGKLDAWIDFNGDGQFDDSPGSNEIVADSIPMNAGDNPLNIPILASAIGGVSYARFRISTAGNLTPTNAASDGEIEDYQVSIPANAPPAITSNGSGPTASINVVEGATAVTTVDAGDIDIPAQSITYSISGGADASRFAIVPSTGILTFVVAPDFELPTDNGGDNVYDVVVRATDVVGDFDSQTLTVHVLNKNDPPLLVVNTGNNTNTAFTMNGTGFDNTIPLANFTFDLTGASKTLVSDLTAIAAMEAASDWGYEITIRIVDTPGRFNGNRLMRDDQAASRRSQIKGGGLALDFANPFDANEYWINWFSGFGGRDNGPVYPITDAETDVINVSPNEVTVTIQVHRYLDNGTPTIAVYVPVGQVPGAVDSPELVTTVMQPGGSNIGIGAITASQPGGLERFAATGTIRGGRLAQLGPSVPEGGELNLLNQLQATDPDDTSAGLTYTLTSAPANGRVEFVANPGVAIYSFTQQDIDSSAVRYVHNGTNTLADAFNFSLADGGEDGTVPIAGVFHVVIIPAFRPPTVTTHPAAAVGDVGGSATFTAAASNSPAVQWQVNTGSSFVNVTNDGVYSGATSSTLTISGLTLAMSSYRYRAVFTNDDGAATSNAAMLTVNLPNPVVNSVASFIGPTSGGTTVVILGSGFIGVTGVRFGGVNAVSYTINSISQITAVAPAGSAGTVNVTVTSGAVTSTTAGTADDFTYALPAITSVIVNGGPIAARNGFGAAPVLLGQNSRVTQILATFNQKVTLDVDAFNVVSLSGSVVSAGITPSAVNVAVAATGVAEFGDPATGYSQYVLTFASGAGVDALDNTTNGAHGTLINAIKDGFYQLNAIGARIHAGGDTAVDRADKFWSLFGAANVGDVKVTGAPGGGDDTLLVDGLALGDLYATFGSETDLSGPPTYNPSFDWNLDGFVDGIDLTHGYTTFGTIWRF